MYKRVISQAPLSVVTLDEAKSQLNIIDDTDEDTHIELLIGAATKLAQKYTGRLLSVGTVEILVSGVDVVTLPYGEVETITSATVTGDDVNFIFEPISQELLFTDVLDESAKVKVTFDAGYTDDKVPFEAKMGVLMLISSLYENREDSATATVNDIPLNSTAILDSIKLVEI